ncbi:glucosaminidase domain-containing protein [Mammaliicoccus sciuri]|uniref:glucosaminidase domain-containing protein n=1 Tax=Mammaliicoccus sciuri TaxID=1296 RepID=UPI003F890C1D
MGLPSSGKPTANDVKEWAISRIGKRLDVDGYYGSQCWDLPNYLLRRYWGFTTSGNAKDMAWYKYPSGFQVLKNTPSFVPKPGDFAVWQPGYGIGYAGHTAIVIGPSTTSYFYSVDQNWRNANVYNGSPGSKEKHSYNAVSHFIRPPYKEEPKQTEPKPSEPDPTPSKPVQDNKPSYTIKERIEIEYTTKYEDDRYIERIFHNIVKNGVPKVGKYKGVLIKNGNTMRSVSNIYNDRNKFNDNLEYPHFYVDTNRMWSPRNTDYIVPSHPDYLVIEIVEDLYKNNESYLRNQAIGLIVAYEQAKLLGIKFDADHVKADKYIWRSMKQLVDWDMNAKGFPSSDKYDELVKKFISMYDDVEKILDEIPKDKVEKTKVKVANTNKNKDEQPINDDTNGTNTPGKNTSTKVTTEKSKYTTTEALNKQMTVRPQVSNGVAWYNASTTQTRNAMNVNTIWNSKTQVYQMLDLGKYQGIAVSKLNELLKGKGTLSGQGKAFAEAGKKYRMNEIYLIAHAILETGNGSSYFASGNSGYFNMYGIGAFDSNPNNAISFARNQGWNTASKAIIGGARFIRQDYIDIGQNTLYRMRWNPKKPATHQYATDIKWCQHQATTIKQYYTKIGLKGQYFIRDKYKDS